MDSRYFSDKVVKWYELNKRDLPWRETNDPYKIWLSEIILQQTRVNQGLPYYLRFIKKFPNVTSLAAASEQEILRLWQGLGYYSRARNLHKCAREVVQLHHGLFPNTFESLKKLPGIGEYTAAAIASISFKESVAVVDGNVFRVLSRVFGIEEQTNSTQGKKTFAALANTLVSKKRPDLYNQAVMEFGALFCAPRNPPCHHCIFEVDCIASQNNLQHLLPLKKKAKAIRKRYFYYLVVQKGNSLLMKKRDEKDIWQGLYDFLLIEKAKPAKIDSIIGQLEVATGFKINARTVIVSPPYKQVLSHQIIESKFIVAEDSPTYGRLKGLKFYSRGKIDDLPKPVLVSRFLNDSQLL